MDFSDEQNFVLQNPILLKDDPEPPSEENSERKIPWEASAMGLASILLGLGILGLLLSLCAACIKHRRGRDKINLCQNGVTPYQEDRITSLYNSIQVA